MLERLWAGWRSEYVSGFGPEGNNAPQDGESIFSRILASGLPDDETHIVARGSKCFVILNAYPYCTGHLMVLPYREVAQLEDLTADESLDLWATVTQATQALRQSHRPHALNVGINLGAAAGGSIARHLHVHVVPRWNGDSNFMTSVADTRAIPEPLSLTASKVRAAWPKGDQ